MSSGISQSRSVQPVSVPFLRLLLGSGNTDPTLLHSILLLDGRWLCKLFPLGLCLSLWHSFSGSQASCLPSLLCFRCGCSTSFEMVMPRYFADVISLKTSPCRVYGKVAMLFFLVIHSRWHLAGWNSISHSFSHTSSLLRSSCSFWQSSILVTVRYTTVSLANSLIPECCVYLGISSMYTRKRTGLRTDPWGTPLVTDTAE